MKGKRRTKKKKKTDEDMRQEFLRLASKSRVRCEYGHQQGTGIRTAATWQRLSKSKKKKVRTQDTTASRGADGSGIRKATPMSCEKDQRQRRRSKEEKQDKPLVEEDDLGNLAGTGGAATVALTTGTVCATAGSGAATAATDALTAHGEDDASCCCGASDSTSCCGCWTEMPVTFGRDPDDREVHDAVDAGGDRNGPIGRLASPPDRLVSLDSAPSPC